jgi:hypothetical protein
MLPSDRLKPADIEVIIFMVIMAIMLADCIIT